MQRGYSLLPSKLTLSEQSMLILVFQVHIGVKGFVTDSVTGAGLENATISVAGINHNITTGRFGDFHRLLVPGTYNITAVLTGYEFYLSIC